MDFENEMTLAFPEKQVYDSSEINYDSKISDKTKILSLKTLFRQ